MKIFNTTNPRLRNFEPENPKLWVPRTIGLGWDLNIGAVAVKLGLIRPDDSLPDLEEHIPREVTTTLRIAPILGAAAVAAAGIQLARTHDRLPSNWGLTMKPTRWSNAPAAVAPPVLISVGSAVWATATPRVDVTLAAQALGLQTMSLLLLAAAARPSSRMLPAAGLVTLPAVATGILTATVRSALNNLDTKLKAEKDS
ncbi:DUF5808 domain-containing protein [Corynebacterium gallinarum]|uniref:DUF5808 domain-containing protein n=1 Tax=Corynebacterium gallinarum TaxID=2762214 RepID=A0A8I0HHD8_9CORY|nr:DUF5808 domain-containing protein [Corynebacterium gallinarum]MBD8030043.1 hypothetical protein [Corynebacterium gallinarum]NMB22492.1 hypothetical protein [Corynebacterium sp.]